MAKNTLQIEMNIDGTEKLDEVLEKANRIKQLLLEIDDLIRSLGSVNRKGD